jgi:hypothetical protein
MCPPMFSSNLPNFDKCFANRTFPLRKLGSWSVTRASVSIEQSVDACLCAGAACYISDNSESWKMKETDRSMLASPGHVSTGAVTSLRSQRASLRKRWHWRIRQGNIANVMDDPGSWDSMGQNIRQNTHCRVHLATRTMYLVLQPTS